MGLDNRRSQAANEYRKLYKCKRWLKLRLRIFLRDNYTCAMCGQIQGNTSKLAADHITPHKGDMILFWNENNIQTLCTHPCHSSHKQSIEVQGYSSDVDGQSGWPIDPMHPSNRL